MGSYSTKRPEKRKLFDYIEEHNQLSIINCKDSKEYNYKDVLFSLPSITSKEKNLVFLYLESDLISVACYLTILNSPHTIALLSSSLETTLKRRLENEYNPYIIFDQTRENIDNFTSANIKNEILETHFHFNIHNEGLKIHDNCKILLSTSGTTGSPKFVKLSEDNIIENALSIADYLPINRNDCTPLNLPLFYSYGFSIFNSNAISGGKIVCNLPMILDNRFWEALNRYKFTSIAGIPYIYEMLSNVGFFKKNLPSLKYLTQAGGHLNKKVKKQFYKYAKHNEISFFVMYGQTEAAPRISYVPANKLGDKLGSIGIPIKNGNLDIDNETGELLYSGPNIFGGYASKASDLEKWETISSLKTGDLAKKDKDGYFYIKGRIKRFVKIFGNRINLDELENILKLTTNTSQITCLGIDDKFILVAHSSSSLNEEAVTDKLFKTYKIHGNAVQIKYFDDLPKTENGKINYKKIEKLYNSLV